MDYNKKQTILPASAKWSEFISLLFSIKCKWELKVKRVSLEGNGRFLLPLVVEVDDALEVLLSGEESGYNLDITYC